MKEDIINLKCPKCGNVYKINIWEINYCYCCDDCSIILYPEYRYGEEA